jgi:hypothetical protein
MCAAPKKTDTKRAELADGSIVCWPREYDHLEREPATENARENRQRVVAALKDCQRTPPSSEYAGGLPEITGRYEGPRSQCCINQAGFYAVLWWSHARPDKEKRSWFYGATFEDSTGRFLVHEADDPSKVVGSLVVLRTGSRPRITFEWSAEVGGPTDVLERYSPRATLSNRAMEAIQNQLPAKPHPVVLGAIESEHTPLSPAVAERYVRGLEGEAVRDGLQLLFREEVTHTADSWAKIQVAIEPLTVALNEIFFNHLPIEDRGAEGTPLHDTARELRLRARVRHAIQEVLHGYFVTLEVGKSRALQTASLLEWFQRAHYHNETGTGDLANPRFRHVLQTWIGVSGHGQFSYEVEIDLDGVVAEASIPLGKKLGDVVEKYGSKLPFGGAKRISKELARKVKLNVGMRGLTGPLTIKSRGLAQNWEATYWVYLAVASGGGGGARLGLRHLRATGMAESNLDWRPEHFVGALTVLSGVAARDKQGVLEEHQLIWIAEGSHPSEPSIQLLLNRVVTNLPASTLGIGWGDIMDPYAIGVAPDRPIEPKIYSYSAKYGHATDVSFTLGSGTVLEDGRQMLRILAANELASLRDASTVVTFHGFADRLGGVGYNDVLSEMRAENAKTALVDCLDGTARATMSVHGHGERLLALLDEVFDFPDQSPSPEWRRVFVLVHGEASVELVVRDLKDLE